MLKRFVVIVVIAAVFFGGGFLTEHELSQSQSQYVPANYGPQGDPQTGTVISINRLGPVWEGGVQWSHGQFPARFFTSGIQLHVGENIHYINEVVGLPDGTHVEATFVLWPEINAS